MHVHRTLKWLHVLPVQHPSPLGLAAHCALNPLHCRRAGHHARTQRVHALLPDGVDSQQSVLTAYAHLKNVVLRGRSVRSSQGVHLTPSASSAPSSGSTNDAEGAVHARLKARFVKTYEEKISWLHLFGTYHHV